MCRLASGMMKYRLASVLSAIVAWFTFIDAVSSIYAGKRVKLTFTLTARAPCITPPQFVQCRIARVHLHLSTKFGVSSSKDPWFGASQTIKSGRLWRVHQLHLSEPPPLVHHVAHLTGDYGIAVSYSLTCTLVQMIFWKGPRAGTWCRPTLNRHHSRSATPCYRTVS